MQQDRSVLARFFNGTATSIISSYSRKLYPFIDFIAKSFPETQFVGFEIYMYKPSTRSRDVYMCIYIRKQWYNRDGCIIIEKRYVIKCCPKVIDMEVNGKMWKIIVDVLQVSSLDSKNREMHIILNGTKYGSEYFLKRQIMAKIKISVNIWSYYEKG